MDSKEQLSDTPLASRTDNTMTLCQEQTFPRFGELPAKIRDRIWDIACVHRYDRNGVHYFSVLVLQDAEYYVKIDPDEEPFKSRMPITHVQYFNMPMGRFGKWKGKFTHCLHDGVCHLAAPRTRRGSSGSTYSWQHPHKRSSYLSNYGLWKACVDSNRAMVRYEKEELESFTRLGSSLARACIGGNEMLPILLKPERDLFFLDHEDIAKLVYDHSDLPIHYLSRFYKFSISNIAFEFDPSWIAQLSLGYFDDCRFFHTSPLAAIVRLFCIRSRHQHKSDHIWLLDRRSRVSHREGYQRFHSVDGSTYIETVYGGHSRDGTGNYEWMGTKEYRSSAVYFKHIFDKIAAEILHGDHRARDPDGVRSRNRFDLGSIIKILSCQEQLVKPESREEEPAASGVDVNPPVPEFGGELFPLEWKDIGVDMNSQDLHEFFATFRRRGITNFAFDFHSDWRERLCVTPWDVLKLEDSAPGALVRLLDFCYERSTIQFPETRRHEFRVCPYIWLVDQESKVSDSVGCRQFLYRRGLWTETRRCRLRKDYLEYNQSLHIGNYIRPRRTKHRRSALFFKDLLQYKAKVSLLHEHHLYVRNWVGVLSPLIETGAA